MWACFCLLWVVCWVAQEEEHSWQQTTLPSASTWLRSSPDNYLLHSRLWHHLVMFFFVWLFIPRFMKQRRLYDLAISVEGGNYLISCRDAASSSIMNSCFRVQNQTWINMKARMSHHTSWLPLVSLYLTKISWVIFFSFLQPAFLSFLLYLSVFVFSLFTTFISSFIHISFIYLYSFPFAKLRKVHYPILNTIRLSLLL